MQLIVNGQPMEVAAGSTLAGLLEQLRLDPARVVVERNRQIVPQTGFVGTRLAENDTLEIVRFMGGG